MNKPDYGIKHEPPAITAKVPKKYPWLSEDKHCDVCVTGGGLTGAMCAMAAAEAGLSVTLITSGGIGFGNTGHLTGCAPFDFSTLTVLDRVMSADDALELYSEGWNALDSLQNLCGILDAAYRNSGISTGFERRDSLLFTDDPTELELLEREYLARSKKIPDCTFLTRQTAHAAFDFPVCGGILTKDGGAVFQPCGLAHLCLIKAEEAGAEIFEQTEATDIQTPKTDEGCVVIKTSTYRTVYADKLILATGSQGISAMTDRHKKRTALTSIAPLSQDEPGWSGRCLLRTFGKREINCCIPGDGTVAASTVCAGGGLLSLARKTDQTSKFHSLREFIQNTLPGGGERKIRCEYSYEYFATPDGLPVIGRHENYKNCIFALCSGTSSFICSQIAAKYIVDLMEGKTSHVIGLFDPKRAF